MNSKNFKIISILLITSFLLLSIWQYTENQRLNNELDDLVNELSDVTNEKVFEQSRVNELTSWYDALSIEHEKLKNESTILDRMEVTRLDGTLEMILIWNRDYNKEGQQDQTDLQFDIMIRDFYGGYSWMKTYENIGVGNNHPLSAPLVIEDNIYYVVYDTFYGYKLETGEELFSLDNVATLRHAPIVDEDQNFYFVSNFAVYKVSKEGELIWELSDDEFDYIGSIELVGSKLVLKTSSQEYIVNFDGTFSKE